jgi:hypothetical protein
MPISSKRGRLNVTLSPESRASLERFSEVTGIAASQLIRSIMHDSVPVIDAMTDALAVVKTSPRKAADIMGEQLLAASFKAAQGKLDLDEAAKDKMRKRPRKP